MKQCTQCKVEKPTTEFYFKGRKADGRLHSECKKCFNNRMMKRYEQRAKVIVDMKGGSCYLCGYDKCVAALEFHHMDPSQKDFEISKRWSMKDERIKAEIDKCVLLCSNCHAEVHYNEARGKIYNWTEAKVVPASGF
ncbi:HNH endonuclease [Pseudomonas phage PAK_P4]|uniref:HNH endonuclease n=1 Tax=Pseudomonas phage PAK_P4 TaxID=1327966 RepID=V5JX98_9CAUD|nr:HNH endonuclease [Pseudomonas phage PAK_P4]AGR89469.1 hypothetical protein PAK_P400173 [Pseudomonas phage PAK_P4]